jgi:hypothetical protein
MNPPYGRNISRWIRKAFESARAGATVVCLVPARTDTNRWFDYCAKGEIRFIKERLKFGNAGNAAPFPSAVIIFSAKTLFKGTVKYIFLMNISDKNTFYLHNGFPGFFSSEYLLDGIYPPHAL